MVVLLTLGSILQLFVEICDVLVADSYVPRKLSFNVLKYFCSLGKILERLLVPLKFELDEANVVEQVGMYNVSLWVTPAADGQGLFVKRKRLRIAVGGL